MVVKVKRSNGKLDSDNSPKLCILDNEYKEIRTIEEAELYLKEKFNYVYGGSRLDNGNKLLYELIDIILQFGK